MAFKMLFILVSLATLTSAHFQIQYPQSRGVFNDDAEIELCDGYSNAASNRSDFPISGGLLQLDNHHSDWSEQNPSNFSVFNTSTSGIELPYAVDWFSSTGAGSICIPVDVASLGIESIGDGSNVTLQAMFTSGDINLFQCVNVSCTRTVNGTIDTASSSTTAISGLSANSSGAQQLVSGASGLLGLAAALLLL